jgi:Protein of unknown function (DUF2800)
VIKYPTGSKLWLNAHCLGWHTVDEPPPPVNPGVNGPAEFGSFMHSVAENETLRRFYPEQLDRIARTMTAEQEAAFNPHYTDDIGAPMDSESWGASVVALQDELFRTFKPFGLEAISVEKVGSVLISKDSGELFATSNLSLPDRSYDTSVGLYGTGDLIYVTAEGDLVVCDWKTGKKAVSPENNSQLDFLAFCWLNDWQYYSVKPSGVVWLVIGDVRNQELRVFKSSADKVRSGAEFLREILEANERNTELTAGVHCDLCPRAGNCPAIVKKIVDVEHSDPTKMSADELAEVAILARKLNKEIREILISKAELDETFRSKYLTKGPKGWRLSAYDVKE